MNNSREFFLLTSMVKSDTANNKERKQYSIHSSLSARIPDNLAKYSEINEISASSSLALEYILSNRILQ